MVKRCCQSFGHWHTLCCIPVILNPIPTICEIEMHIALKMNKICVFSINQHIDTVPNDTWRHCVLYYMHITHINNITPDRMLFIKKEYIQTSLPNYPNALTRTRSLSHFPSSLLLGFDLVLCRDRCCFCYRCCYCRPKQIMTQPRLNLGNRHHLDNCLRS
jgi:hypothetical protein